MRTTFIYTLTILFLVGMVGCAEISEEQRTATSAESEAVSNQAVPIFHTSHKPKKQNAPFSDAVAVGNTFYLSGQIGMNHSVRELVAGGIQAETKQTLENIRDVLEQHDMAMMNVVKVQVILDDIEDFAAFNEVYVQYFPQKPARTTFAAEALAKGAKIEIEVIAVKESH